MLHQIAGFLALIKDMNQIVSTIRNPFKWGQGNIGTALGWNIGEGQMSNYQEWKYGGSWENRKSWAINMYDEVRKAVKFMIKEERFIAEGGSCMTIAAVMENKERIGGKNIALVISGGNIDGEEHELTTD